MNEAIGRIMAKAICPICKGKVKRDVHIPRFGSGKNIIVWQCTNGVCTESTHWNKGLQVKHIHPVLKLG